MSRYGPSYSGTRTRVETWEMRKDSCQKKKREVLKFENPLILSADMTTTQRFQSHVDCYSLSLMTV